MRILLVTLILVMVSLIASGPVWAQEGECPHVGTTVQSLQTCVEHALENGHIDNAGVATSLLAKLDAAQAALDRGQTSVAINNLKAFIQEVRAQGGVHIRPPHDEHLVRHAQAVIGALT